MAPAPRHSFQEQEDLILDAAVKCFEDTSITDFKMSAISKAAGLSMGSIYKHIQTKEDVLVALAMREAQHCKCVFEETLSLPLTPAEKLIAVKLLTPEKMRRYSFGYQLQMLMANEAMMDRASESWITRLIGVDRGIDQLFADLLSSAADSGDLVVNDANRASIIEEVHLNTWAMCVGFIQVAYHRNAWRMVGIEGVDLPFPLAVDHAFVRGSVRLINSYPWKEKLTDEGIAKACMLLEAKGFR